MSSDEEEMSIDEEERSIDSEGSISDSWDSDTEWDEDKLVIANERKYWNR